MSKSNHVFVSYTRSDKALVDRLTGDLRSRGVDIWRDVDDIRPGQNWELEIKNAVGEAVALLFVFSQHSRTSKWMAEELASFADRNAPIIPLILDDDGEKNLPAILRRFQWVDFRSGYESALQELLKKGDVNKLKSCDLNECA